MEVDETHMAEVIGCPAVAADKVHRVVSARKSLRFRMGVEDQQEIIEPTLLCALGAAP